MQQVGSFIGSANRWGQAQNARAEQQVLARHHGFVTPLQDFDVGTQVIRNVMQWSGDHNPGHSSLTAFNQGNTEAFASAADMPGNLLAHVSDLAVGAGRSDITSEETHAAPIREAQRQLFNTARDSGRNILERTVAGGTGAALGAFTVVEGMTYAPGIRESEALGSGLHAMWGSISSGDVVGASLNAAQTGQHAVSAFGAFGSMVAPFVPEADAAAAAGGTDYVMLHHGTNRANAAAIRAGGIDLSASRANLDFGRGFYTTTDQAQAATWAARSTGGGEVLSFRVPTTELSKLNGLTFDTANGPWADFVRANRQGAPMHGYDFVEGPMLGNPRSFLKGNEPSAWGQQTSFHSPEALDLLMRSLQ